MASPDSTLFGLKQGKAKNYFGMKGKQRLKTKKK